jgi:hypothetical protein
MDVKDYSVKLDQARDRYREAQEELRSSYDKSLEDVNQTHSAKEKKQSTSYAEQKTKLEEQNLINNDRYTEKTREAVAQKNEAFKNRLKENTQRFEEERNSTKHDFKEKLTGLSESFKKSSEESNRYNDQIRKTMGERYQSANKRYADEFNEKITDITDKTHQQDINNRANDKFERQKLADGFDNSMESERLSNDEQKFKEVSRLRDDIENIRTTFGRERDMLVDRQDERVADLVKNKGRESNDTHQNFEELQKDIRNKNIATQERQVKLHKEESKDLEEKFSQDIRNIQRIANQKVKGGTKADTLNDELKQTKTSYENRLATARKDMNESQLASTEKENYIDKSYRDKMKDMKSSNVEKMEKKDLAHSETMKKAIYDLREKDNSVIDRYKGEAANTRNQSEAKLTQVDEKNAQRYKEQRVEFGKVVNTMNEKNMNTISSLKEDFAKDKTESIERSKKDFSDEKVSMKSEFQRQVNVKDSLYESRLSEMEKQTNKIIDNYENRISQIVRKAEKEVETIKSTTSEAMIKEEQANKFAVDNIQKSHRSELLQLREKWETKVARDRAMNEQQTNRIIQKYEDQLDRERNENAKMTSIKLNEAQSQLERLFSSSEQEKENIRIQSEARIENMRLASLAKENTKKS